MLLDVHFSVNGLHRRKAVVRDWFGNGSPAPLKGRIEFTQQSEYDVTNVHVALDGLDDVNNYKIHIVSYKHHIYKQRVGTFRFLLRILPCS